MTRVQPLPAARAGAAARHFPASLLPHTLPPAAFGATAAVFSTPALTTALHVLSDRGAVPTPAEGTWPPLGGCFRTDGVTGKGPPPMFAFVTVKPTFDSLYACGRSCLRDKWTEPRAVHPTGPRAPPGRSRSSWTAVGFDEPLAEEASGLVRASGSDRAEGGWVSGKTREEAFSAGKPGHVTVHRLQRRCCK